MDSGCCFILQCGVDVLHRVYTVADLRRRPEGAMPPLREETAINKAPKLLL